MASRDAREAPHGLSDANCGASTMPTPHALLDSGMRGGWEEHLNLQHAPLSPSERRADVIQQTVQDEGLKRLLMSWYYAGFYTGLHQGQQQRPGQR